MPKLRAYICRTLLFINHMGKNKGTEVAPHRRPAEVKPMSKTEMSRTIVSSVVVQGEKRFLQCMDMLEPRDYCDVYIKLLKLLMPTEASTTATPAGSNIVNYINQLSVKMLTEG